MPGTYISPAETGLYYLNSRYYDPETCRFINADGYVSTGQGLIGFNMFAYCGNNPVNFYDETGEFFLTALIVGVVVGAVVGAVVGGTAAYESAKESGAEGSDLFWKTVEGIGKGATVGAFAGGIIGLNAGVIWTFGMSYATCAMTSATISMTFRTGEVIGLQYKKSKAEGKSTAQIVNDVTDSLYNNGTEIMGATPFTKSLGVGTKYALDYAIYGEGMTLLATLNSTASGVGMVFSGIPVIIAEIQFFESLAREDPVARAAQRGYVLS